MQFMYGSSQGSKDTQFGNTESGTFQIQVKLSKDEYIQELVLDFTIGKPFLTRVYVQTNVRDFGPFGGNGGRRYTLMGSKLMYVAGQSGPLVNQLTAYFDKCS